MVSNLGRVKSIKYLGHNSEKVMKAVRHHTGYQTVSIGRNPRKTFLIHVLVAQAFIPNPENKPYVNHMDGNKQNNKVDNLEWVTAKENQTHAINFGLRTPRNTPKRYGKDNPLSKPVLQYDCNGNFVKRWDSQSDVARFYGCKPGAFSNCINNPHKLFRGFMWITDFDGHYNAKIEPSKSRKFPKPVNQISKDGNLVKRWNCLQEIKKDGEYNERLVGDCCRGTQKTYKGFVWRYAED